MLSGSNHDAIIGPSNGDTEMTKMTYEEYAAAAEYDPECIFVGDHMLKLGYLSERETLWHEWDTSGRYIGSHQRIGDRWRFIGR